MNEQGKGLYDAEQPLQSFTNFYQKDRLSFFENFGLMGKESYFPWIHYLINILVSLKSALII